MFQYKAAFLAHYAFVDYKVLQYNDTGEWYVEADDEYARLTRNLDIMWYLEEYNCKEILLIIQILVREQEEKG